MIFPIWNPLKLFHFWGSVQVFITEHDVLGGGLALYHVDRYVKELGFKQFRDGNHIIYVNGSYKDDSSEIGRLVHDFRCTSSIDMYNKILKNGMQYCKETEGGRTTMCKAVDDFRNQGVLEGIQKGRKQGILEGRTQGSMETKIDSAQRMLADKLPFEKIAEYTGLPLSKVQELADGKTA